MDFYYISGKDASATLFIYTKDNDPQWASVRRNTSLLTSFYKQGISVPRDFYSPKYNVEVKDKYDARTTIYWSPHLSQDTEGKHNLAYYNADEAGKYRIIIEGIGLDGKLARKMLTYYVNP